ncbi:MAG TPA: hypothetical protein P5513_05135 [Candidatus Diapherotrites archaeon]|nr:hypothetical protein [Candidatus Diapherotrites archaeon]
MKKFKGYYCIGCSTKKDAINGKGLLLWSENRPSKFIQFTNRLLLNIYWVNKERESTRGDKLQNETTSINKEKPDNYKKVKSH